MRYKVKFLNVRGGLFFVTIQNSHVLLTLNNCEITAVLWNVVIFLHFGQSKKILVRDPAYIGEISQQKDLVFKHKKFQILKIW